MISKNVLIIAHRGESFDAPENTIAAINLAWKRNADAVEIDIQLTKDKKIVVVHDEETSRITGVKKIVKNSTLAELRELDFGSFKGVKWKDEKIPTLTEVLKTIPSRKKLIIEIKCGPQVIQILQGEIQSLELNTNQIEFIGFDLATISKLKMEMPNHNVLWINELDYSRRGKLFSPSVEKLIKKALENNLDGLDLWAGNKIKKELIDKVKNAGLLLYLWTVNNEQKAIEYKNLGVDGITTDKAHWLKSKIIFS